MGIRDFLNHPVEIIDPRQGRNRLPANPIEREMHSLDGPSRALPRQPLAPRNNVPHLTQLLNVIVGRGGR
eukprot:6464218-Pyramimonas_sp.AAC.1